MKRFLIYFMALTSFAMCDFMLEHYVMTTRCNVTQDTAITTPRGVTYCGSLCLGHANCSGFRFSAGEGGRCQIYGKTRIAESADCDHNTTNIYVQRDLALAQNMSLLHKHNGSHGNNSNNDNNNALDCKNGGTYDEIKKLCQCVSGWVGEECESLPGDCPAIHQAGYRTVGLYTIHPPTSPSPFQVFCFLTPTHGLTQIQAHSYPDTSFNRSWSDFKNGFAFNDLTKDFWLGNQYIHYLTTSYNQRLLMSIQNRTTSLQYIHNSFAVANEEQDYSISFTSVISSNIPGAGACWNNSVSLPFSTYDKDNDGDDDTNCAAVHGAGWWFESKDCTRCNLNGRIDPEEYTRQGKPEEAFVLPIDPDLNPKYVIMALFR